MTPFDAYVVAAAFVVLLLVLTAILENTAAGRRVTDRAIERLTR